MFAQIHLPQVGRTFKGRKVIQILPVLAHNGITQTATVWCQSDNAVLYVLKLYCQDLGRIGILFFIVFLLFLIAIVIVLLLPVIVLLLIFLFQFLQKSIVFCRKTIAVVSILR